MRRILLLLCATLVHSSVGEAQGTSAFQLMVGGKPLICALRAKGWETMVRVSGGGLTSAQEQRRTVVRQLRKARGAKKLALERSRRSLNIIIARGKSRCRAGPNQPGAAPLIQPTPTPTPNPGFGCFVPGNNTSPGCFGIPTPLSGNIERGQSFYQANCRACHVAVKNNRTWNQVSVAFSNIPQMNPFRPDDQTLADIVAYLNRFNY